MNGCPGHTAVDSSRHALGNVKQTTCAIVLCMIAYLIVVERSLMRNILVRLLCHEADSQAPSLSLSQSGPRTAVPH